MLICRLAVIAIIKMNTRIIISDGIVEEYLLEA